MRIVVIDDSETFRHRVVRHLAEDPTMEVVGEAADGDTGYTVIDEARPDVVLLDLYMPRVDGFSVLRRVKDQLSSVKVIVLTSDASESVRQRCANLRADVVIDKSDAGQQIMLALRSFQ